MKPILFSTPMVQAIIDGRKAMTRRVIKLPAYVRQGEIGDYTLIEEDDGRSYGWTMPDLIANNYIRRPYKKGDALWVRETWAKISDFTDVDTATGSDGYLYKAEWGFADFPKWRPSIFMPREAARIFLRVTDVRVERVQDISEKDALAEGIPDNNDWPMDKVYCPKCKGQGLLGTFHPVSIGYMEIDCPDCQTAAIRFGNLWDSLNAKRGYGWESNPWVWVITFERTDA